MKAKGPLVLIHLINACSSAEAEQVIDIMARPRDEKTETEVESVLHLMRKYKSITYAQQRSQALLQEAAGRFQNNFAHLADGRAKQLFFSLIRFFVEREY